MDKHRQISTVSTSEFEGVIKQILDIDDIACQATEMALEERKAAEENIEKQKQELKQKYLQRAQERIEKVRQQERKWADSTLESEYAKYQKKLSALEALAESNIEKWADEIFKKIVG